MLFCDYVSHFLMCGPRQLFFQCDPEMPKGWTHLHIGWIENSRREVICSQYFARTAVSLALTALRNPVPFWAWLSGSISSLWKQARVFPDPRDLEFVVWISFIHCVGPRQSGKSFPKCFFSFIVEMCIKITITRWRNERSPAPQGPAPPRAGPCSGGAVTIATGGRHLLNFRYSFACV